MSVCLRRISSSSKHYTTGHSTLVVSFYRENHVSEPDIKLIRRHQKQCRNGEARGVSS